MYQEELVRPDQSMTRRISEILERKDIHINQELIEIIVAATNHYYFSTPNGRQDIAKQCMMDITFGETDMEYRLVDTPITVSGDDICFLSATVIKGRFVKSSHVDAYSKDKNTCDMCNSNVHCTTTTKDEYGKNTQLCNSCMSKSDLQRIRDLSSGLDGCKRCSTLACQNNPAKDLDMSWLHTKIH